MKRTTYNSPAIEYLEIFPEGCLAASLNTKGDADGLSDLPEKNYGGLDW